jgi:hypothetical protein
MTDKKKKTQEKSSSQDKARQKPLDEFGNHIEKFAVKTAESIQKVIDKALSSRNTVLTIRVNDDCNRKLNMLVEAGLFKSRSESAAFLIQEGIKSQDALYSKIGTKFDKIDELKVELRSLISEELGEKPPKKSK